jgi:uncharacterized protein YoxC
MKRAASPEEFRRTLSERCIATGVCSSPPRWQWPGSEPEEKGRAQVSSAKKTISGEINGVQTVSADVVGSLKAIQKSVSVVADSISSVASAVEQQSAATSEISATMQAASSAATRIDQGINTIASSMEKAARGHPASGKKHKALRRVASPDDLNTDSAYRLQRLMAFASSVTAIGEDMAHSGEAERCRLEHKSLSLSPKTNS